MSNGKLNCSVVSNRHRTLVDLGSVRFIYIPLTAAEKALFGDLASTLHLCLRVEVPNPEHRQVELSETPEDPALETYNRRRNTEIEITGTDEVITGRLVRTGKHALQFEIVGLGNRWFNRKNGRVYHCKGKNNRLVLTPGELARFNRFFQWEETPGVDSTARGEEKEEDEPTYRVCGDGEKVSKSAYRRAVLVSFTVACVTLEVSRLGNVTFSRRTGRAVRNGFGWRIAQSDIKRLNSDIGKLEKKS